MSNSNGLNEGSTLLWSCAAAAFVIVAGGIAVMTSNETKPTDPANFYDTTVVDLIGGAANKPLLPSLAPDSL